MAESSDRHSHPATNAPRGKGEPAGDFADRVRRALDTSAAGLDGPTLAKLHAARNAAIAARRRRPWLGLAPRWALGISAALAAGLLVFALLPHGLLPVDGNRPDEVAILPEDFDLLTEIDHPDDFDDLAFYEWLAANEHSG